MLVEGIQEHAPLEIHPAGIQAHSPGEGADSEPASKSMPTMPTMPTDANKPAAGVEKSRPAAGVAAEGGYRLALAPASWQPRGPSALF